MNSGLIYVFLLHLFPQGLQHQTIHPSSPFGLPLDFQTLPGQLREVGKQLKGKIQFFQQSSTTRFCLFNVCTLLMTGWREIQIANQDRPTTTHQYHEPFSLVVWAVWVIDPSTIIKIPDWFLIITPVDSHSSFLISQKQIVLEVLHCRQYTEIC